MPSCSMPTDSGSDDYRAWIFTLASAMACVFGAGLIFIDTAVKKILGRDVRMLQDHKVLAGSLGLGSGVMIFSSFYNLLPEAKMQLASELSIFRSHADAALMLFFFGGVAAMAFIHWIIHRFHFGATSPGIESSRAIEQFMQRESVGRHQQHPSLLSHHHSANRSLPHSQASNGAMPRHNVNSAASTSTAQVCDGCVLEESDEDDYNDSEYVDDEVTSLLNNAFLQIGKTPNSRMDDTPHMQNHHTSRSGGSGNHAYDDDDEQSIEVVIADQKDKILRRALDNTSDLDMDFHGDDDDDHHGDGRQQDGLLRENSWSSVSTRSQKPFAPGSKRRKSGNVPKVKVRKHNKDCPMDPANDKRNVASKPLGDIRPMDRQPLGAGINTMSTYGATPSSTDRNYNTPSLGHSRSEQATHLRRTSFPRLKASGTFYSRHDSLDHTVADDREHADLTEIGIQTALTIAIHKFPEGLITFLSTTADPCLGLSVFMAISVHNLIEGYLIAFPLFVGLHSRVKAFALAAALGGLSQPLGAVMGWFILRKVASMGWQVSATGCIYALVAGMMSSIAVNGMWPQAVKCVGRNPTKVVQYSFFGGIAVMGICQAVMGTKCDF